MIMSYKSITLDDVQILQGLECERKKLKDYAPIHNTVSCSAIIKFNITPINLFPLRA